MADGVLSLEVRLEAKRLVKFERLNVEAEKKQKLSQTSDSDEKKPSFFIFTCPYLKT